MNFDNPITSKKKSFWKRWTVWLGISLIGLGLVLLIVTFVLEIVSSRTLKHLQDTVRHKNQLASIDDVWKRYESRFTDTNTAPIWRQAFEPLDSSDAAKLDRQDREMWNNSWYYSFQYDKTHLEKFIDTDPTAAEIVIAAWEAAETKTGSAHFLKRSGGLNESLFEVRQDYLGSFHLLARLLAVRAELEIKNNNTATAIRCWRAMMQCAEESAKFPGEVNSSFRQTILEIARKGIVEAIRSGCFSAEELTLLQDLFKVESPRDSYLEVLESLRAHCESVQKEAYEEAPDSDIYTGHFFFPEGNRLECFRYMSMLIDTLPETWNGTIAWMESMTKKTKDRNNKFRWKWRYQCAIFINKNNFNAAEFVLRQFIQAETSNSVFRAFVATARYRKDHGRFPDSLDQLVPSYLNTVPLDLCNENFLRYKRIEGGNTILIWSVGENQINDGGDIRMGANESGQDIGIGWRMIEKTPEAE